MLAKNVPEKACKTLPLRGFSSAREAAISPVENLWTYYAPCAARRQDACQLLLHGEAEDGAPAQEALTGASIGLAGPAGGHIMMWPGIPPALVGSLSLRLRLFFLRIHARSHNRRYVNLRGQNAAVNY